MSPIEAALIRRKLGSIVEALRALEPLEQLPLDEYRKRLYERKAAERLLQEAIDINAHVIAERGGVGWSTNTTRSTTQRFLPRSRPCVASTGSTLRLSTSFSPIPGLKELDEQPRYLNKPSAASDCRVGTRPLLVVLVFLVPCHLNGLELGFIRGLRIVVEAGKTEDVIAEIGKANREGIQSREFFGERDGDIFGVRPFHGMTSGSMDSRACKR
jgi:hypothetical protein